MALKDLVAQKSALTEEAIEEIVKDYVRYDPDAAEITFTPEFASMSNKAKILVYLVAVQGWEFVVENPMKLELKPAELEERLHIPGGTLRPVLKDLKDRHLITLRGDGYTVRHPSLPAIKKELEPGSAASAARPRRKATRARAATSTAPSPERAKGTTDKPNGSKGKRRTAGGGQRDTFDAWVAEGFFDEPKTLADVQARFHEQAIIIPQTSIPKFLLGAVRGKRLARVKEDVKGKERWVYRTAKG